MDRRPELFESAWLKWSWAVAHSESLKAHMNAWATDPNRKPGITLDRRYDAKRHRVDVFIDAISPLPIEWGLVIGDIAHNYRSCLDHIAWALVERGRTPTANLSKRVQSGIYFPTHGDRAAFNAALPKKLPGIRRADSAIVRRFQPYHGGKRKHDLHAFAVLSRLSNMDKHRAVQPTLVSPQAASYEILGTRDCVVSRIPAGFFVATQLHVGAQLAPIYVRKTGPHPDVDVKGQLSAQPALPQGVLLGEWVEVTQRLVAALLGELSDPPTELLAKLGGPIPNG